MSGAGVSPTPATLQHDTKGNMTIDDRGCTMVWDGDNMLQNFAANGVANLKNATYEYDAIGRRVAKNVAETGGAQTTLFVQAGQQVTCEYTPGNASTNCDRKYAYGTYIDEVLNYVDATAAAEARYWLSQNRQYSVYATLTIAGAVAELYRFDAYGKILCFAPSGTQQGRLPAAGLCVTFTGRVSDNESDALHFRARTYSTSCGRFMQRDDLGYINGRNLEAQYFHMDGVDPYGRSIIPIAAAQKSSQDEPIVAPPNETLQLDCQGPNNGCYCEYGKCDFSLEGLTNPESGRPGKFCFGQTPGEPDPRRPPTNKSTCTSEINRTQNPNDHLTVTLRSGTVCKFDTTTFPPGSPEPIWDLLPAECRGSFRVVVDPQNNRGCYEFGELVDKVDVDFTIEVSCGCALARNSSQITIKGGF